MHSPHDLFPCLHTQNIKYLPILASVASYANTMRVRHHKTYHYVLSSRILIPQSFPHYCMFFRIGSFLLWTVLYAVSSVTRLYVTNWFEREATGTVSCSNLPLLWLTFLLLIVSLSLMSSLYCSLRSSSIEF